MHICLLVKTAAQQKAGNATRTVVPTQQTCRGKYGCLEYCFFHNSRVNLQDKPTTNRLCPMNLSLQNAPVSSMLLANAA